MIITDKITLPDNISFEELARWWCKGYEYNTVKYFGVTIELVFFEQGYEYTGLIPIASYNTLTREIIEYEAKDYHGISIIGWIKKVSEEKNNEEIN